MDKWAGKVAVVTGASSGIGAATAKALVHHGLVVVGLARRVERVQQLAAELGAAGARGRLLARRVDLRQEAEILETFTWLDSELGGADILVNNAGLFYEHYLTDGESDKWRELFDVNVLAVAFCTREYLKSMERRSNQNGHVFIINSVAGHVSDPKLHMYCGTKHAVKAVAACLRRELAEKKSSIKVTSVSPGPVATEIWDGSTWEGLETRISTLGSEDVAKAVVDALSASPVCQVCEVVLTPVPTDVGLY